MEAQIIWQEVLEQLKPLVGDGSYEKWFEEVRCVNFRNNSLVLWVPDKFHRDWIEDHYAADLHESLLRVVGYSPVIDFVVGERSAPAVAEKDRPAAQQGPPAKPQSPSGLSARYTFDNFMVGPSNQFAHAACKAVAELDARNYNPLFIYGGVGLGKTHLLNAIGNHVISKRKGFKVVCITTENFVNELVMGIRYERMNEFRNKYRKQCNMLLMDDVHVLSGKEQTQEEFFFTFNDLYSLGKKVVITSDRVPKDMPELEERLRSRFESGIIVDIQAPEFETRLAILTSKAEEHHIELPHNVALFLAEKLDGNIRTLEGTLIRLSAFSSFAGQVIDLTMAGEVLSAIHDEKNQHLSAETMMKAVSKYFQIKVSDLKSKKRNRKYAYPRHIAMYLCREHLDLSFPEIGHCFGGKDHATVIHACSKIKSVIEKDYDIQLHVNAIKKILGLKKS